MEPVWWDTYRKVLREEKVIMEMIEGYRGPNHPLSRFPNNPQAPYTQKAGNMLVMPLVFHLSMGSHDCLPSESRQHTCNASAVSGVHIDGGDCLLSGDPSARLPAVCSELSNLASFDPTLMSLHMFIEYIVEASPDPYENRANFFPINCSGDLLISTNGALGPISIATAPAPPVGRAGPLPYTAISPATTMAFLPSHDDDSTQLTALNRAAVPP
uniref:SFRICE_006473 n=1 Tax=Spodoptera frugiperda TaxID=7108 RepID=A0A2H1VLZ8_SPOFR